jgi:hypothetical protein
MGIGTQNGGEPPPAPDKIRWWTGKMTCKTMRQTENDQNYKKESTPVVGQKPYGKSRLKHRITNAVTEGLNSKIQSIKSAARGFRNFNNYRTRILFFCGKLDLYPL